MLDKSVHLTLSLRDIRPSPRELAVDVRRQHRPCQPTRIGPHSSIRRTEGSQQALFLHKVHRQPAVEHLLQWRDSRLQKMAPPHLDSPTTASLVRKLCAPASCMSEHETSYNVVDGKQIDSTHALQPGTLYMQQWVTSVQGTTMIQDLGTTMMPTVGSTLTAPRSNGWRWTLRQGSSVRPSSQTPCPALLLRAP